MNRFEGVFYRPGTTIYHPPANTAAWRDWPGKVAYCTLTGGHSTAYLSELHDDKVYVGVNKHTDEPVAVIDAGDGWVEIPMEDRR